MEKKLKIFESLLKMADLFPVPIYWLDRDTVFTGANNKFYETMGVTPEFAVGTTGYDVYPYEIAFRIVEHDKKIMSTEMPSAQEEPVVDLRTGGRRYFMAYKTPIYEGQKVVGLVGTLIEVTAERKAEELRIENEKHKVTEAIQKQFQKEVNQVVHDIRSPLASLEMLATYATQIPEKVFDALAKIADLLPTPIYWLDINATLVGANQRFYQLLGINSTYVGTNAYDVYPYEVARHIVEHDKKVMKTAIASFQEETTRDIVGGQMRVYEAFKEPLKGKNGVVVGLVGSLIDITHKKEAENLKIENEKHKITEQIQKQFQKEVNQVVHDIRSPLASLEMLATYATHIPEKERENFRRIATTISDIANNFLNKHNPPGGSRDSGGVEQDCARPTVVALLLQHLLSEKRFEYQSSSVEFVLEMEPSNFFTCLSIQPLALKRALSNLINNAVEALDSKSGRITLGLAVDSETVVIQVMDNGKGMPEAVKSKILQGISVTAGKAEGHGIGMGQVLEMVKRNGGELKIDSVMGDGTSVQLEFKAVSAPDWLATEINLYSNSVVVVLDDDDSIHQAWDARFIPLRQSHPLMAIHHFKRADEALRFIKQLTSVQYRRLFLLSDYELLNQDQNGLEVIKAAQPCLAVLVTSHYNNVSLQKETTGLSLRILPKELASKVSINLSQIVDEDVDKGVDDSLAASEADLVLVEDNVLFASQCLELLFADYKVDHYVIPEELLRYLSQYPKDTPFALDNHYEGSAFNGMELADQLHKQGYTRLYLLSGDALNAADLPDYLTPFLKNAKGLEGLKGVIAGKLPIPLTTEKSAKENNKVEQKGDDNPDFLEGIMGFIHRIVHDVRSPLVGLGLGNKTWSEVLPVLLAVYSNREAAENNMLGVDESIDRKIKQILRSQTAGYELYDTISVCRLNEINETVWGNFHNLLEKQLDPEGFVPCKIYHVIHYAMNVCCFNSKERELIHWERDVFFDFRGNEIASIALFKNLLTLLMEQMRVGYYQDVTIKQALGDTQHAVHLKQVANSASLPEHENDLAKNVTELANRLGIKLERHVASNQDVAWVLFFPALPKSESEKGSI